MNAVVTLDRLGLADAPAWASEWGDDEFGVYADFEFGGAVQRMRRIPPGSFWMGSPPDEPERMDDELQHEVELTRAYWFADTACTQKLWQAVMGSNPSHFRGEGYLDSESARRPVENISWEDCQEFIRRINRAVPSIELRLPTEAEWEYACRAGTLTPFWFGETVTPEQANYNSEYPYAGSKKAKPRRRTLPVKSLPMNSWGLYQMHGNVWEWCADRYGDYPAQRSVDPTGPETGKSRVLRGGSVNGGSRTARSACRCHFEPRFRQENIGVRLARSADHS